MNCAQQTVSKILETFIKNGKFPEIGKDFKPKIYNLWIYSGADNVVEYNTPLLYYNHSLILCSFSIRTDTGTTR